MSTKNTLKPRNQVASAPAPLGLAEELLDQLVAFRPIDIAVVETQMGESEATIAQVVTIDAAGVPHNRGEVPIFWVVIRDQLRGASEGIPWIAGTFTQAGRAYRLRELTSAEVDHVARALDDLPS